MSWRLPRFPSGTSPSFPSASLTHSQSAHPVVAADCTAATWACPSFLLCLKKPFDTVLLNKPQVFNQAHPITAPVTLINRLQASARKTLAFITKLDLALAQRLAVLFQEGAFLVSYAAAAAIGNLDAFAFRISLQRQETCTHGAVHSTRRNQLGKIGSHNGTQRLGKKLVWLEDFLEQKPALWALPYADADFFLANFYSGFVKFHGFAAASWAKVVHFWASQVDLHWLVLVLKLWED